MAAAVKGGRDSGGGGNGLINNRLNYDAENGEVERAISLTGAHWCPTNSWRLSRLDIDRAEIKIAP